MGERIRRKEGKRWQEDAVAEAQDGFLHSRDLDCPLCGSDIHKCHDEDEGYREREFIECNECGLSFHESFLAYPESLDQVASEHRESIRKDFSKGRRALFTLYLRDGYILRSISGGSRDEAIAPGRECPFCGTGDSRCAPVSPWAHKVLQEFFVCPMCGFEIHSAWLKKAEYLREKVREHRRSIVQNLQIGVKSARILGEKL